MQDRDYHELGDADLKQRMRKVGLPVDAKELSQPASIQGEVTNLKEPVTEGDRPVRQGAAIGGRLGTPPKLTFSQLPDGRMFFTVELAPQQYDLLTMADRQALLDGVLDSFRQQLAQLWSLVV